MIVNGICRKWPKELYLNLGSSGGVSFATAIANARARGLEMPYDRGREVIAFDMDNDGDMDLAAANEAPSDVLGPGGAVNRLFRNTGSAFQEVTNTPVRREISSTSVMAGDIDGNGFHDLLFVGQGGVRIYKNSGGTFGSPTTIVPGARQIELAQINGDTLLIWSWSSRVASPSGSTTAAAGSRPPPLPSRYSRGATWRWPTSTATARRTSTSSRARTDRRTPLT